MTLNDYLALFGLLTVFLGIGLLLYVNILGLLLRFHLILFPKIHSKLVDLQKLNPENTTRTQNQEPDTK